MFEWLMTQWQEIWSVLQPIAVTFILTAFIGWQREAEEHNTGIRAFPIVGMASCGYLLILGPQGDIAAQSRVLQGLITGIGFVGGGAILKEGATIRGTATAASIWNAGVIGAAVAMNHYDIAIALSILNLVTLRALLPIKIWLDSRKSPRE
ncbi:MAG TPA: MgtC/SapB family protein [Bryobacteraceae bacterium]|nr:MgtC/SapB family protein [Bryobacteraceae bacterium]